MMTKSSTKSSNNSPGNLTTPRHKNSTNQERHSSIKKKIVLVVKVTLVVGLLYFLIQKGFISLQATQQALKQWQKILTAFLTLFFTSFLGIIRWQWLLRAHNIHLKWTRTIQLNYIGTFFNLALPGAVSGDFVKAFYIGKEVKGQRSRAFGSILFDRVAGLSALVFVSAGALLVGFDSFSHSLLLHAIQYLILFAAIVVFCFFTYLFLVREHHDPLLRLFRYFDKRISKFQSITRIYEGLRHYHNHRLTVIKVLALSIVIHLLLGYCCYNLALAVQPTPLSLLPVYVIVPLGLLVTAVPIAPAGVGTGNVAFLYFFSLIGFARGADVYSLYALLNILIGCMGGIIYFRFRSHEPTLPMEETTSPQTLISAESEI